MKKVTYVLCMILLVISACADPEATQKAIFSAYAAHTPTATLPPMPTLTPIPTSTPTPDPTEALIVTAKAMLQQQDATIAAEQIVLKQTEAVQWPDGGLGCPEEGVMYPAVITAGYRFTFEAQGQEYVFHSNVRDTIRLCLINGARPMSDPIETMISAAKAEIVALNPALSLNEITLVQQEATNWPDSSLGCPEEGMMYAQVITPGYRFIFTAGGRTYEVHTDEKKFVKLCLVDEERIASH